MLAGRSDLSADDLRRVGMAAHELGAASSVVVDGLAETRGKDNIPQAVRQVRDGAAALERRCAGGVHGNMIGEAKLSKGHRDTVGFLDVHQDWVPDKVPTSEARYRVAVEGDSVVDPEALMWGATEAPKYGSWTGLDKLLAPMPQVKEVIVSTARQHAEWERAAQIAPRFAAATLVSGQLAALAGKLPAVAAEGEQPVAATDHDATEAIRVLNAERSSLQGEWSQLPEGPRTGFHLMREKKAGRALAQFTQQTSQLDEATNLLGRIPSAESARAGTSAHYGSHVDEVLGRTVTGYSTPAATYGELTAAREGTIAALDEVRKAFGQVAAVSRHAGDGGELPDPDELPQALRGLEAANDRLRTAIDTAQQ
jgi:hypothetical protein